MYILNRKGNFKTTESLNQCKDVGHNNYFYHLQIVTKGLDKDGFVIEHQEVQDAIEAAQLYGSCEELSKKIFKIVKRLMKGQKFYAYRSTIAPKREFGALDSYMEFKWYNKKIGPAALLYLS
jgi:hypothetical protein